MKRWKFELWYWGIVFVLVLAIFGLGELVKWDTAQRLEYVKSLEAAETTHVEIPVPRDTRAPLPVKIDETSSGITLTQEEYDTLVRSGAMYEALLAQYETVSEQWSNAINKYSATLEATSTAYPIATHIYWTMREYGLSAIEASAIMGNIMLECGYGDFANIAPTATNSTTGAYGICQWLPVYNPSVIGKDLDGQLDYLLNDYYKGDMPQTSVDDAAKYFVRQYERPTYYNTAERQRWAREAYVLWEPLWIMHEIFEGK